MISTFRTSPKRSLKDRIAQDDTSNTITSINFNDSNNNNISKFKENKPNSTKPSCTIISKEENQTTNLKISDIDKKKNEILKRENASLKLKIQEYESRASNQEMRNNALLIKLSEAKSEISQLQYDKKRLSLPPSILVKSEEKETDDRAVNEFYFLISAQSIEISELHQQRESILKLIQKFRLVNSNNEDIIKRLTNEISDLKKEKRDIEANALELENRLSETMDMQEFSLSELYKQLLDISPIEHKQNLSSSVPIDKRIIDLFKSLKKSNSQSSSNEAHGREIALLGHLENAVKYIDTIVNSSSQSKTKEMRTLIFQQVARIKQFITQQFGNEEIQQVADLFQAGDPEKQAQTFFSFVDKTDISNSPIQELYTLFCAVIEVNNLLFSHLDLVQESIQAPMNQNKEIHEENKRLHQFYNDVNAKLESIADLLADCPIEPNDDIFDMIYNFIEKYISIFPNKNHPGPSPRSETKEMSINDLRRTISPLNSPSISTMQLTQQMQQQQQQLKQQKTLLSKGQESIKKLKTLNSKLKEKIISDKKKEETYICNTRKKISELKKQLCASQEISAQLKEREKKLLLARKNIYKQLKNTKKLNKELNGNVIKLTEQNSVLKASLEQSDDLVVMKKQKLKSKISKLKERIEFLENSQCKPNTSIIHDISFNHEDVISHYKERTTTLDAELEMMRQTSSQLQEKLGQLTKDKNDQIQLIAKLKVSERSLNIKISQMQEYIKFKDGQNEAQSKSKEICFNTETEKKIRKLQEKVKKYELLLKNLVESNFNIQTPKDTSFEDLITTLADAILKGNLFFSQETLKDATEIRNKFNLKITDSILEAFLNLSIKVENCETENEKMKTESKDHLNEIEELRKEVSKINIVNSKINEWEKWASFMFTQVAEGNIPMLSMQDIRFALEETLLASIGHRTIRRKINILRLEKGILIKFDKDVLKKGKVLKIKTMKPLILIVLFNRKLQAFSGCIPPDYRTFTCSKPKTTISLDDY